MGHAHSDQWIETETIGSTLAITFAAKELEWNSHYEQLAARLNDAVRQHEGGRVLLDFGKVGTISSIGLGLLVRFYRTCRDRQLALRVCNLKSSVLAVLRVCQFTELVEVVPTRQEALGS